MKGQKQYEQFKSGKSLTPKQAILAQCYVCNGENEGGVDCLGVSCPLYQFMPYREGRTKKVLTVEQKARIVANFKRGRGVPDSSLKTPRF
jgi:hypothetical protein